MQPTRRGFLKTLGLGAAAISLGTVAEAAKKKRPNVILVMTDDQGYGDLACHGNPIIQTPNIDALHKESVRLTNFHVGPTCSPTRAGLMTGRYCNRTGVWHTIMGRSILRKNEMTMADVFSANGYKTAIFGKWHMGDNYPARPQDKGFQEVLVHGGGGVTQLPDYWGNSYFDDTYFRNGKPEKQKGYCTDVWFNNALNFIEKNRNEPFFCYVPTNAPHSPFNVADKYKKLYEGKKGVPNAAFWGMITNIDENMGRLVKKMEELDLVDNTILIYMTDNGTAAGFSAKAGFNAGMRGTKGSAYDGGHRVPCFWRWPNGNLQHGKDVSRLTAHIDMLPTLMSICGMKAPRKVEIDGTDISKLLTTNGNNWPDRMLVTDSQRIENPEKWRQSAVMSDRWRLINGKELYDMPADPGQTKNIAKSNPEIVSKMRDFYEKWWASVSVDFDKYSEIIIGSDHDNPSTIYSHDWHGKAVPWNQGQVKAAMGGNGFWAIEVDRDATYEFELRRWPQRINKPINGLVATESKGGKRIINVTSARLQIAGFDATKAVKADDTAVVFRTKLKAGKKKMQTWFMDDKGKSQGAYFVYAKRM